jgi:hypothetical protein
MRDYRQRKLQEIKLLGNCNFILFPGYVLCNPFLEEIQLYFIWYFEEYAWNEYSNNGNIRNDQNKRLTFGR